MRWSYKTVHYELKKEGLLGSAFLDESEMELSLNEYGKAGWELVSMLETMDGLIAIFKQPLSLESDLSFPSETGEKLRDIPELEAWQEESVQTGIASESEKRNEYDSADKEADTSEPMQADAGTIRIE